MFSSYILNTAIEQGGDRETDGDEDRMTGTYAADRVRRWKRQLL